MSDPEKPKKDDDEAPFVSDSQFELDLDNFEHSSVWPKILFGVVVAIGIVLGVMYVKNLGPFRIDEPKPVEVPAPVPASQPVALPPLPAPAAPVVPVVKPVAPVKAESAKKAVSAKKAAKAKAAKKKKKHHR